MHNTFFRKHHVFLLYYLLLFGIEPEAETFPNPTGSSLSLLRTGLTDARLH